jgi:hypothetical protein
VAHLKDATSGPAEVKVKEKKETGVKSNPALIKNAVFWDVTPRCCCKNLRFGGTYRFHHHWDKNLRARNGSNN